MTNKIIYYYQTFTSLKPILQEPITVTHIHLSSIHFGYNKDKTPYIHLNDYEPDNYQFDDLWDELELAHSKGIKIILMVGGAGGAFTNLFSNFNTYYKLLCDTINQHSIISGIDLDVEEFTSINNIKFLINKINNDFGNDFIISMAPISIALEFNGPGLGGFSYKQLLKSDEGKRINYFNGQFYGCFNFESFKNVVDNGFPADKIVIGMLSSNFNSVNFNEALNEVKKIKDIYSNFGGVFVWEYFQAYPNNPAIWANKMHDAINNRTICESIYLKIKKNLKYLCLS